RHNLRQSVEGWDFDAQDVPATLQWYDELRQDGHDHGADNAAGDAAHAAQDHHRHAEEDRVERELAGRQNSEEMAEQPTCDAAEECGNCESDQTRACYIHARHLRRHIIIAHRAQGAPEPGMYETV